MENRTETFIVDYSEEGIRLDSFIASRMESLTRSHIQKLIEEGMITVNGASAKSSTKTKPGMVIVVTVPEARPLAVVAQDIPLDIVFEDESIIVINKPKNLVVHPAAGNQEGTLVNALLHHCRDSLSDINGVIRPGIVHRIDKDTTGLLVIAKSNEAHLSLSEQLKNHQIRRTYEAIVDGRMETDSGKISAPIGRHPVNRKKMAVNIRNGKPAVTHFRVLERFKAHTYIRCELETGRTHQIRVHMSYIGHPVTGDEVYGKKCRLADTEGQVLHARYLKLKHPVSNEEMVFEAPLPAYFTDLLDRLRSS
ncbi:MAG TPA: RluA family pseudouridine synthase [Clostridiaceae bacterium]|nr:RluA family pseudouridine synthase [Clostridiaceae bacterium]